MVKTMLRSSGVEAMVSDEAPLMPPVNLAVTARKGAPEFGCRKGGIPASINAALCSTSEDNQLTKSQLAEIAGVTMEKVERHLEVWHPVTGVKGNRGVAAYLKQVNDRFYLS